MAVHEMEPRGTVALEDDALIRQCLGGRVQAFGPLVDRYQTVLFNLALRMVNDVQDAEDITQTVFLKAYEKLDRYDPEYKFFSWLYRIAVNEALTFLKRRQPFMAMEGEYVSQADSPAEACERDDVSERVGDALLELSPEDRAIIILRHFQDFSYDEVAFVFEIPIVTVKSRLYTARQRLKGVLLTKGLMEQNR
jgi:RNA polymerase sigma-70 factor, ECF subfamily